MRFYLVHKTCSYLMVATSLAALFMTGELNPIIAWMSVLGLIFSWFWEAPNIELSRFNHLWNGLTLCVLIKTIADLILE